MHWVDWVIIGILALSTLASLWRGFVREALSLASWVSAFVLATLLADRLASVMSELIGNETARYVAAWILVFIVTLVLGALVGSLMRKLIRATGLGGLDRILGTVFGFARGLLIVIVIVYIARELVPPEQQGLLRESRLLPHVEQVAIWARGTFSELSELQPRLLSVLPSTG